MSCPRQGPALSVAATAAAPGGRWPVAGTDLAQLAQTLQALYGPRPLCVATAPPPPAAAAPPLSPLPAALPPRPLPAAPPPISVAGTDLVRPAQTLQALCGPRPLCVVTAALRRHRRTAAPCGRTELVQLARTSLLTEVDRNRDFPRSKETHVDLGEPHGWLTFMVNRTAHWSDLAVSSVVFKSVSRRGAGLGSAAGEARLCGGGGLGQRCWGVERWPERWRPLEAGCRARTRASAPATVRVWGLSGP